MDDATKYGFIPDPGERILRVIRRNPITLVPAFIISVIMIILALGLVYIAARYPNAVPHAGQLAGLLAMLLSIFGVAGILVTVFVYRRNALIFTNIHLIQSEQIGLFNHRVSQINFERVQDVSGRKVGIWQSLFNFGDVEVQSAGEQEKFIFHGASNPSEVADDALQTRDTCIHDLAMQNTPPVATAETSMGSEE